MDGKRTGILFYDKTIGAYNIQFRKDSFYDGLYRGEYFYIKVKNVWIPVRMEKNNSIWYLAGMPEIKLDGLIVCI